MPEVKTVPVDRIRPSPFQPRVEFDKRKIKELAESVKATQGLLQPIVVRKDGDTYQIIVGERRWRAYQFAEMEKIPALVKDASDIEAKEMSLIENWHRLNLKGIEEEEFIANLYKDGKKEGRYNSISDMARKTGIPRPTLSEIIHAHKERKQLNIPVTRNAQLTYKDLSATRSLKNEQSLREKVLDLRAQGSLKQRELRSFSKTVKKASKPVRKALLQGKISPEEAKTIEAEMGSAEGKERVVGHIVKERSTEGVKSWVDVVKAVEESKDREAKKVERPTGDIWICPICGRKFRLLHVDPTGTHKLEEVEEE